MTETSETTRNNTTHYGLLVTKCGCQKYVRGENKPYPLGRDYIVPLLGETPSAFWLEPEEPNKQLTKTRRFNFKCYYTMMSDKNSVVWEYHEE